MFSKENSLLETIIVCLKKYKMGERKERKGEREKERVWGSRENTDLRGGAPEYTTQVEMLASHQS